MDLNWAPLAKAADSNYWVFYAYSHHFDYTTGGTDETMSTAAVEFDGEKMGEVITKAGDREQRSTLFLTEDGRRVVVVDWFDGSDYGREVFTFADEGELRSSDDPDVMVTVVSLLDRE